MILFASSCVIGSGEVEPSAAIFNKRMLLPDDKDKKNMINPF